jgi:hypothetical protein
MPTDDQEPGPLIRRRSTGEVRTDIDITGTRDPARYEPAEREPIRVVGRPRPRPVAIPEPRMDHTMPGRATAITYTTASFVHLLRVVLPRYLVAGLILGGIALAISKLLWVALIAAGLPLPVFLWWALGPVRKQARAYRRGDGPPPPGYLGKI